MRPHIESDFRRIHTFLNIAIPFSGVYCNPANHALDELGNLKKGEARDALRDHGVHFMSIFVLDDSDSHSAFLIIEATIDCHEKAAVDLLVDCIGDTILKILGTIEIKAESLGLAFFLNQHRHQVGQKLISTPGLNFFWPALLVIGIFAIGIFVWELTYSRLLEALVSTFVIILMGLGALAVFLYLLYSRLRKYEDRDEPDNPIPARFGSEPPRPDSIETSDVQTILFGGVKPLRHACCLLVKMPEDVSKAQAWLTDASKSVTFGDAAPAESATLLSLARSGLERLGQPCSAIEEFPVAFEQGMSTASRANILGDTGTDKPQDWWWGNEENPVDAALLLYHTNAKGLESLIKTKRAQLRKHQLDLVHRISMQLLVKGQLTREPFGFVDGISQPIIRGAVKEIKPEDKMDVVEPGEFLLGYHDNRGSYPLTPTVPADADPQNILPTVARTAADDSARRPGVSRSKLRRDLGRNGSYLVIRQLEQDVEGFQKFLDTAAKQLGTSDHPGIPKVDSPNKLSEWVGAKMVGRWRDGTSLVRHANRPGSGWDGAGSAKPDNDFRLGADDPLGYRCPIGAHIRRGNPRDTFNPGSDEQIAISNRHRILQVGRPYQASESTKTGPDKPGLLFMCLNSDIERQFEFVQQTWLMARHFHRLDGEVDSLVGRGKKGGRLTIPSSSGPIMVKGIQDFVTTRGGTYLFLPSKRALRFLSS